MRMSSSVLGLGVLGVLTALPATEVSAQGAANLTGRFVCIQNCRSGPPGTLAFVTQNGRELNLAEEGGGSSRAWPDWFTPNRIWVDNWDQSAVVSPDGMTIQFDRGAVWQRDLGLPPRRVVRVTRVQR